MENSITGGGGVSEGHFPYPIFFYLFFLFVFLKLSTDILFILNLNKIQFMDS